MALSKTLIALGNWIEKRFPEKLTAGEVREQIAKIEYATADNARGIQTQNEVIGSLVARIVELEKKAETLNSDMNKTKVMLITQRQSVGR
jgi:hypothetical protein